MSTDLDTTRIVRSWLRTDEHESADRVLDDVLARLDTTPQRPSWWPARRSPQMNALTKFAIAAAAVVAIAIVGINLLPRTGGNVGGMPTAPPSPTATLSPTATPSIQPTLAPSFPPTGDLAVGQRHSMVREGVQLSFTVPTPGWQSGDQIWIDKGEGGKPDSSAIIFWPLSPDNVYADPCGHVRLAPAPERTAADLAAAVAAIPGIKLTSGPTSVTVGGHPAQHVRFTIPATIGCPPDQFYLWFDETDQSGRWAQAIDEMLWVWIIDVDGTLVWIDGETYKGAKSDVTRDLQEIINSIQFE